jgi:hypothetical protein
MAGMADAKKHPPSEKQAKMKANGGYGGYGGKIKVTYWNLKASPLRSVIVAVLEH